MRPAKGVMLFIAGMLLCGPVWADIYKWVDEKGKVHFSDQAQQGAEQIHTDAEPATHSDSGPSTREINQRIKAVNNQLGTERIQQQNAKTRESRSVQARQESNKKNCQYYRDKLDNLEYEWELRTTRKGYKQSEKDRYLIEKDRYQRDIARICG